LNGYSGFSSSNNFSRGDDSDYNGFGTGAVYSTLWVKNSGNSGNEQLFMLGDSGATLRLRILLLAAGTIQFGDDGATASVTVTSGNAIDDGNWHKLDWVRRSSTDREAFIDGVSVGTSTTDAGSLSGTINLTIGVDRDGSTNPATTSTISLVRLSAKAPTATQIRQMYDAEKPMFVASAECLLQSSSTDAVLDVDVDPLTGKVLVTQTDAITIFDGLAIDSKPTVNSGNSEKGKLWGDLRAEQNSANAYVTAPAVDQRQVNEMVRGLASDLPKGVDLSKAKAFLDYQQITPAIYNSMNISSVTDTTAGKFTVYFAIPFKNVNYIPVASAATGTNDATIQCTSKQINFATFELLIAGTPTDRESHIVFFGELENE